MIIQSIQLVGNAKLLGSQQSVDRAIWSICDIMRRSNCAGALQYVPELTWILFLRILDEREAREAEEAAKVLGASPLQRFFAVIVPQLAPAVAAGFGLAFARSMNEYGVVVLLSGNVAYETLVAPVYVYQRVEAFDFAGATAVAAALLAICLAVLGATHAFQRWSTRHGG